MTGTNARTFAHAKRISVQILRAGAVHVHTCKYARSYQSCTNHSTQTHFACNFSAELQSMWHTGGTRGSHGAPDHNLVVGDCDGARVVMHVLQT